MSTHNIGFYEDLTKIIFELSSNIIKYAPYFFCWVLYRPFGQSAKSQLILNEKCQISQIIPNGFLLSSFFNALRKCNRNYSSFVESMNQSIKKRS